MKENALHARLIKQNAQQARLIKQNALQARIFDQVLMGTLSIDIVCNFFFINHNSEYSF